MQTMTRLAMSMHAFLSRPVRLSLLLACVIRAASSLAIETAPPPVPAPEELRAPVMIRPDVARRSTATRCQQPSNPVTVSWGPLPKALRVSGNYLGLAHIDPASLAWSADSKTNASHSEAVPGTAPCLEFELEGRSYRLHLAEEVNEERLRLRHVTMSSISEEGTYARFSVDISKDAVYGTLRTSSATYVFEPGEVPGAQTVYQYEADTGLGALDDKKRELVGTSELAQRHHQIEVLATIQPYNAYIESGSVSLIGGDLGVAGEPSVAAFKRIVARLAVLTRFTGAERFRLENSAPFQGGGMVVYFRQLIDGIPLADSNRMGIDGRGAVVDLSIYSLPEGTQHSRPLLATEDAIRITRLEWAARFGAKVSQIELMAPAELQYQWRPRENVLEPVHVLHFCVPTERVKWVYSARVDAISGAVEIDSPRSD